MLRWALAIGRTPRELLAAVTSDDITEMMAFERFEPFGALHTEAVIGQLCALIANAHFKKKGGDDFTPLDYMPNLARAVGRLKPANDEPILLDDPEAQTALIKATIFGVGRESNG